MGHKTGSCRGVSRKIPNMEMAASPDSAVRPRKALRHRALERFIEKAEKLGLENNLLASIPLAFT